MNPAPPPATTRPPRTFDTSRPHSARVRNYWLGGNDNYPADREAGDTVTAVHPDIATVVRESRRLSSRLVGHLAGELGVRQFLDLGVGLPWTDNVHDVAQRHVPDSRVVYVDHDRCKPGCAHSCFAGLGHRRGLFAQIVPAGDAPSDLSLGRRAPSMLDVTDETRGLSGGSAAVAQRTSL